MTQDHSALLAQLDALKSADAGAVFAELIRAGLQALIEAEATETIGAGRYERSEGRGAHRNGHRPKTVSTTAGDIEVQIPKLRAGSFFPSLLERRRRIDRALHAVIMEAYVHGVSTRSVDDLVAAMGVDSGVSKSEVSRICAALDTEIDAFRTRSLTHTQFPYVFCDATFCKVRVGAHVVSQALVVATGVSIEGTREVLGTTARVNGGEPDAGRYLLAWAHKAGFTDVTATASAWCFATAEDRAYWGGMWADRILDSEIAHQLLRDGAAKLPDLEEISNAWRAWADDPDGWIALLNGEILCSV